MCMARIEVECRGESPEQPGIVTLEDLQRESVAAAALSQFVPKPNPASKPADVVRELQALGKQHQAADSAVDLITWPKLV